METEGRAIAISGSFVALIGFLIGSFVTISKFGINTYDCTVKCPNNSHSIQFDNVCYCEAK